MHNLLLVTMHKKIARNSNEARVYAYKWLMDNKLACEGGRFCSGMADWFVIGGRWSGMLTQCHLDQRRFSRFHREFGKKYGWWTGAGVTEQQRLQQSLELFRKYFPNFKGLHPFWRNSSTSLGEEDDAMICDEIIFDMLIRKAFDYSEHFCDIEFETECSPRKFINKKWVVIVDCHS